MNGAQVIRRLHEHRAWVNRKLLAAAATLPAEALRKPFPIGQGTIWKSLTHLHAAEYVWLEALVGNETALLKGDLPGKLPGNQESEGAIASLAELDRLWMALEARWQKYLESLGDANLDETVNKVSSRGARHALRRSDILLHVCTHAHYTTAQVINMLRHAGAAELPDPMLITLARQEAV